MGVLMSGTQLEIVRDPDAALRPRYSTGGEKPREPRLIVEIDVGGRGIIETQRICREYFDLVPMLRAVLLVYLSYRKGDEFACLMVLYRRGVDGGAVVEDVVSFGNASVTPGMAKRVERSCFYRKLPLVTSQDTDYDSQSPWRSADRPFLEITAADLFYKALTDPDHPCEVKESLHIDLWSIYKEINEFSK
ncbi:hypothetical protein GN244_ATG17867 [Phytophthora infestans]|uniref:Uncharacterized protein n=1 Tax=Phytophthora infestans TaxID=4787 RepID=A0A833SQ97_PHYIN|nr:hypothetical protein GN244_ATG17867 [Phytophthora infestans]KAF4131260.1 hypothetical protein GN958_ATG19515 [Phytophthora infestans]